MYAQMTIKCGKFYDAVGYKKNNVIMIECVKNC